MRSMPPTSIAVVPLKPQQRQRSLGVVRSRDVYDESWKGKQAPEPPMTAEGRIVTRETERRIWGGVLSDAGDQGRMRSPLVVPGASVLGPVLGVAALAGLVLYILHGLFGR